VNSLTSLFYSSTSDGNLLFNIKTHTKKKDTLIFSFRHLEVLEAVDIISERFDILEDKIDRLRKESRDNNKEPIKNNDLQRRPSYVYAPFFKPPMQSLHMKQDSQ
jgi:hypothetical protein